MDPDFMTTVMLTMSKPVNDVSLMTVVKNSSAYGKSALIRV